MYAYIIKTNTLINDKLSWSGCVCYGISLNERPLKYLYSLYVTCGMFDGTLVALLRLSLEDGCHDNQAAANDRCE